MYDADPSANSAVASVIIANFNGAPYLLSAVRSVIRQTLRDLEIIIVDDGSADSSIEDVEQEFSEDARLRIIRNPAQKGPSAARNAGIAQARGEWIVILDADDLMHPERLRILIDKAQASRATAIVDDLLVFGDTITPHAFLDSDFNSDRWIGIDEFVASDIMFSNARSLGFLKPIISRSFLISNDTRYNEDLSNGEDFDILAHLLVKGGTVRYCNFLGYFYRKHARSISFRISRESLVAKIEASSYLSCAAVDPCTSKLRSAIWKRRASLDDALEFTDLIQDLKEGHLIRGARRVIFKPRILPLLRDPIYARVKKLFVKGPVPGRNKKAAVVICRQRIVGSTSGSSAYLMSLCKFLNENGYSISMISPNPSVFGRWPVLAYNREMEIFDKIAIRGGVRVGRRIVARPSLRVVASAVLYFIDKFPSSRRLIRGGSLARPAPYAVSMPWTKEDCLFVARHAVDDASIVVADYAFQAFGIPYVMAERARQLTVMHDLFSSRPATFKSLSVSDSVAKVTEADELRMLDMCDTVIAIQKNEANFLSNKLHRAAVVTVPMCTSVAAKPDPGRGFNVLFIGSNTSPNVDAIKWFISDVWPDVIKELPRAILVVAGTVTSTISTRHNSIRLLGFVEDIESLYASSAVVVSPLRAGSGLKIKLIEAISRGKAIVATNVSLQGVTDVLSDAVWVSDEAAEFSSAVVSLLTNSQIREKYCRKALHAANTHFDYQENYRVLLSGEA